MRKCFETGRWVVALVLALMLSGCADKKSSPEPFVASDITGADFGRDFRLADHRGKTRTLADFRGKAVLLFFGYTNCPDVCLNSLSKLAEVQKSLGEDAARVQVIFVSLDPERDTPERLANFVTYFNKDFLALHGDDKAIAGTAREFRATYGKHDAGSAAGYQIDHSVGIYAFDPRGHLRLLIGYDVEATSIVHDMKLLLGEKT
ncbi:MAG: SCO family protein [Betaproteobacteria bacterium]|nr:SCO family protein [Betaproteobacteria bacterium]